MHHKVPRKSIVTGVVFALFIAGACDKDSTTLLDGGGHGRRRGWRPRRRQPHPGADRVRQPPQARQADDDDHRKAGPARRAR